MAAPENELVAETRRELHELAILSSALLRLATKVQMRCEGLRQKLGALEPLDQEELDRHATWTAEPASSGARSASRTNDESEPAALLAMSLAGEGLSREQIGDYLRDSFGMQDADELLARVLPRVP